MTLTIKDSPDLNSPGKPGAPSQNSENKTGLSPRSNPVCLEVGITIRSLPNQAGGLTQPIREEGRTVIVFDNGAVLRSTNNMPVGLTVILSNPSGRDVVCKVVGGRNLPSVKGYVEVEFMEPVNDFWNIHQDADLRAGVTPPPPSPVPLERAVQPPPTPPAVTSRATYPSEPPTKPAIVSLGSGPTFDDIPGLMSTPASGTVRDSKMEYPRPGPEKLTKSVSNYNLSEISSATSVANWNATDPEMPGEKHPKPGTTGGSLNTSATSAQARDFLSKGLMAYEQPHSSSTDSNGRMPLILGLAALVLAGIGGVVFFMHRSPAPISVAKAPVVSQPSMPAPPAASATPEPAQPPQADASQAMAQAQNLNQAQAQPVDIDQAQPVPAAAPVPAVVTSTVPKNSRTDSRDAVRQQEKKAVDAKQVDAAPSRRPAIPNLKIGSPSAPNQNSAKLGEGTAPLTDVASTETVGGTPSAALLTAAGRTSNPPAPPPSAAALPAPPPAPAVKTVRDPKMISSTRPIYPETAKQSGVQGTVTVSATIDEYGKVISAKALSGPLLLRQAALDSVRQWKYSPGSVDGKPTPSQVTVGVEFRLN